MCASGLLHMSAQHTHAYLVPVEISKGESEPLELEPHVVLSHPVGAGSRTQVLWKNKCFSPEAPPQPQPPPCSPRPSGCKERKRTLAQVRWTWAGRGRDTSQGIVSLPVTDDQTQPSEPEGNTTGE